MEKLFVRKVVVVTVVMIRIGHSEGHLVCMYFCHPVLSSFVRSFYSFFFVVVVSFIVLYLCRVRFVVSHCIVISRLLSKMSVDVELSKSICQFHSMDEISLC